LCTVKKSKRGEKEGKSGVLCTMKGRNYKLGAKGCQGKESQKVTAAAPGFVEDILKIGNLGERVLEKA